jgi:hypothetical protein
MADFMIPPVCFYWWLPSLVQRHATDQSMAPLP